MHALYARFLPLLVFEQQPGIAVRKEIYRRRGLLSDVHARHPASGSLSPALRDALDSLLRRTLPGVDLSRPLPAELFA